MPKKKTSQKQQDANRRNAAKSTGPKTPEGKAVSSMNAVTHGLFSRAVLLPACEDLDEQRADFDALVEQLTTDLAPQGRLEKLLVERLAAAHWRLRRAFRFETQAVENLRADDYIEVNAIMPGQDDVNRLVRYQGLIDRELHRVTQLFFWLKRHRMPESPSDASSPPATSESPVTCAPAPTPSEPNEKAFAQNEPILTPETQVEP